jgi:hypothetical protein
MSDYDPSLFWGGGIRSNRPRFYRECCICKKAIEHGEVYDASRSNPVLYAHVTCREQVEKLSLSS